MVTLIRGRSGRGKTTYIFQRMKQAMERDPQRPLFLIVPDQMSFQTEYELLHSLPKDVMMNVEVLGLHRFIQRILAMAMEPAYVSFEPLAQKILLQQVSLTIQKKLKIYKNSIQKEEFITYLHQFLMQLKGTNISLDLLATQQLKQKHPLLEQKIQELKLIIDLYDQTMQDQVKDSFDFMTLFLDKVKDHSVQQAMSLCNVYIDGYHTFNNKETEVIIQMLQRANEGMMTFCLDEATVSPTSIFQVIERQFQRIYDQLPMSTVIGVVKSKDRFSDSTALDHLEQCYERPIPLKEATESIELKTFMTMEQEVIHVAQQIRTLLLSGQIRPKEIAVYIPHKETYQLLIERVFEQYDIPYYMDIKATMLVHPVMKWLYLLLRIYDKNWQIDDVIGLLQNDFFCWKYQLSTDDVSFFINYVKQFKRPYKSMWNKAEYWLFYDTPAKMVDTFNAAKTQRLSEIKTCVMKEISDFEQCINAQDTGCTDVLSAMFQYITKHQLEEYLLKFDHEQPRYTSHLTEVQYQEAVWKQLIYIFEQVNLAIGHMPLHRSSLCTALMLGIENAEFTSVPVGFDTVMVGDFERSRFQTLHQENEHISMGIQYAFVLGMIDTFVPTPVDNAASILSSQEVVSLQAQGILEDVLVLENAMNYQLFRLYTVLTTPAKYLSISYFQLAGIYKDEACTKSFVLSMFETDQFNIATQFISEEQLYSNISSMTTQALKKALLYHNDRNQALYEIIYHKLTTIDAPYLLEYREMKAYDHRFHAKNHMTTPGYISVSQLELYNQCPYQYFLSYILGIERSYHHMFDAMQSGILLHEAYEKLWTEILTNTNDPIKDSLEKQQAFLDSYFAQQRTLLQSHPLFRDASNDYMYRKIHHAAKASLTHLFEQQQYSDFHPTLLEYTLPPFHVDIQGEAKYFSGKLDRIDIDSSGQYAAIIDYKSSKRTIDFTKLLHGIQLQLPLYSMLASKALKLPIIGHLYVALEDRFLLLDTKSDSVSIQKEQQKSFQATGLLIDDEQLLQKFDRRLEVESTSHVIPYTKTKTGATVHSMIMSAEELEQIQQFALLQAIQTSQKIVDNRFDITPIRQNYDRLTSPCRFCSFQAICQFDSKLNCYRDETKNIEGQNFKDKKQNFLQKVKQEKEGDV